MSETNTTNQLGEALAIPGGEVAIQSEPDYQIVPVREEHPLGHTPSEEIHWRVVLTPVGNVDDTLALELHGDVVIGADGESDSGVDISLNNWDGSSYGVNARHVMLRPTQSKIYIMDLRSSTGTAINGLPLGVGWAYALQHNDTITLGHLNVRFRVIQQP